MALTMTRTRTQTALTKLAELVANVHGELETVERLLTETQRVLQAPPERKVGRAGHCKQPLQQSSAMPQHESSAMAGRAFRPTAHDAARAKEADQRQAALERRRQVLLAQRDSLYATVRQFDAELDPEHIGSTQDWLKQYGRGASKTAQARYLRSLEMAP